MRELSGRRGICPPDMIYEDFLTRMMVFMIYFYSFFVIVYLIIVNMNVRALSGRHGIRPPDMML